MWLCAMSFVCEPAFSGSVAVVSCAVMCYDVMRPVAG